MIFGLRANECPNQSSFERNITLKGKKELRGTKAWTIGQKKRTKRSDVMVGQSQIKRRLQWL
jgi:hypothetical protein